MNSTRGGALDMRGHRGISDENSVVWFPLPYRDVFCASCRKVSTTVYEAM
jgi:hypothetical protein